ncbi:virB8 family protein [Castellaniella sp. UC4442_H9]
MNLSDAVELAERDRGLERDLEAERSQSKKLAWYVAGFSGAVSLAAVIAVAGLTPLKAPPEMYVLRVNDATGAVEHVSRLGISEQDYGERMARYDINRYILTCEGYDWYTIQVKHDTCQLLSAPGPRQTYDAKYDQDDPKSIINRLGQSSYIDVKVHSITFATEGAFGNSNKPYVATVRFSRTEKSTVGAGGRPAENLVATIAYHYVNAPMSEMAARLNPLGFQVVRYQVDADLTRQ